MVVQLFLLMCYPQKGDCESISQWGPLKSLSILLWSRKGFLDVSFQKRSSDFLKYRKVHTKHPPTLPRHNKMENCQVDPLGSAFADPSGDKGFSSFENGGLKDGILKVSKPFLKHNKMERLPNGPHWILLRRVPSGDKTFSRF